LYLFNRLSYEIIRNYCLGQQLVMPGDYPDPSIVKIDDTYWASATTSNWAPAYPVLQSKDLINWSVTTHVFPQLPAWADYYFWAPEISYDNGKVYLYYAAHKKGGNLCLAVASADKPEGPYTDHGPLMCEEAGSIDAFPIRDENGKLFMVWKEDGNSVGKPTPIWMMAMDEARTKLSGEKIELFRNDAPWEKNLVEGVSMVQANGYYYAFYAAAGCCGANCTYGVGIARAKKLTGPWEKYPGNPVLTHSEQWKCPGHGTPVEKDGKHYFLYHAYDTAGSIYTGRQGVLIEYRFTNDQWIEFVPGAVSDQSAAIGDDRVSFDADSLEGQWQWSVFHKPTFDIENGKLHLQASTTAAGKNGGWLAHKINSANYTATTEMVIKESDAGGGLSIIGDEDNHISAVYQNGLLQLVRTEKGKESILSSRKIKARDRLVLRLQVSNGKQLRFSYSVKAGRFSSLHRSTVDAGFMPPWDRALRVALVAIGTPGKSAVFEKLEITNGQAAR